jgi:16S rRNA G527 N7-methylase RsmG
VNSEEKLQLGSAQLGVLLSAEMCIKLLDYLALLDRWNKVYNLTAIRDPQQMVSNHLLDSLAVAPYLWAGRWLDAGCGAGLPGVVLAVVKPEWHFTLLDSSSKKTSFVQQAIIELKLRNVAVYCARVEEWQTTERFDGIYRVGGIYYQNARVDGYARTLGGHEGYCGTRVGKRTARMPRRARHPLAGTRFAGGT